MQEVDLFEDVEEKQVDSGKANISQPTELAIDPDTGEVIAFSSICLKFGWTELPFLPDVPNSQDLAAFELKIDQITDRIARHTADIARYTEQSRKRLEERTKHKHGAIAYWQAFVTPLVVKLAKHRLPKFQTGKRIGDYSRKTLNLESGTWEFTAGGGSKIFDFNMFKKSIEEQGWEKFGSLGAKMQLALDYQKAVAAVKAGKYAEMPGVSTEPKTPFAKVSFVPNQPAKGGIINEEPDPE